jgi:PAS domain S-box-containing protein
MRENASVAHDVETPFRRLVDMNVVAILCGNAEGHIHYVNEAFLRLMDFTRAEFDRGLINWRDLTPPEYRTLDDEKQAELLSNGDALPYEKEFVRRDGRRIPVLVGLTQLENCQGHFAIVQDLSEAKQAELTLAARNRQQAATAQLSQRALGCPDLTTLFDEAVTLVTETLDVEFCMVFELLPGGQELLLRAGRGWRAGLVGRARVGMERTSQAGYTLSVNAGPVILRDAKTETRFAVPMLLIEHGVVSGMSVTIHARNSPFGVLGAHSARLRTFTHDDIRFLEAIANVLSLAIERNRVECDLHASERRYRAVVEALPVAVYTIDTNGRITLYNDAAVALWGRAPKLGDDSWCGSWRLFWPDGTPLPHCECPMALAMRENRYVGNIELVAERPDGTRVPFVPYATPLHDNTGALTGAVNVLVDISARKAAEDALAATNAELERRVEERTAQLVHTQKMEAMGQLTSGVAHDFNNVLQGIGSCLAALEIRVRDKAAQCLFQTAQQGIERGRRLTQHLLAFARRQALSPKPTDIAVLLDSMHSLIERSMGGLIELDINVAADTWPALVDPVQLELAIVNLAINARDAMPVGGQLSLSAENAVVAQSGMPGIPANLDPGDYVLISVTDTGAGMTAETLAHACEPFFTTKEIGKGSGLGLSMVHGMAAQSGGGLHILSQAEQGTTVQIYVPRAEQEIETLSPDPRMAEPPSHKVREGAGASVLLVEDDELVRFGLIGIVEFFGYRVTAADSGAAALEMLREGIKADLLVTDYAMPGMSGVALVREAHRLRPDLPVLMMTGYAERPEEAIQVPLIQKPFKPEELAERLARVLRND